VASIHPPHAADAATGSARPDEARLIATVAAATFVALVAFTAVAPTVDQTAEALHAGVDAQTWILGGMSVGLASALLFAGTLGDAHGRRRMFTIGTAALAAATAVNAAAPDITVVIAARVLEGIAGAGILAGGLGLIGHEVPAGHARTRATGIWGAMIGAGIAAGPVASAALNALSWRAIWWLVVIAAAALIPAAMRLPERHTPTATRLDVLGAATFAAAMACLTAGLTLGRGGWDKPAPILLLAAGAGLLAAFAVAEHRSPAPLVDLSLFRRALFLASVSGALLTGLALIALMSFLPTVAERALGQSALGSAATLAIWSATSWLVALQTRRLPPGISSPVRLAAGFALCAGGVVSLSGLEPGDGWLRLAPGLLVAGAGSGLANAALGRLAVESVPLHRTAMGSGANNTARYLGGAAGIAMVVAIVTGHADGPGAAGLLNGWDVAVYVAAALCALAVLIALACERRLRADARREQPPDHERPAITHGRVALDSHAENRLAATSAPTPDGARAAVETFYYALNNSDLEVLGQVWASDALAQLNNPVGGIIRGGAEITALYARIFTGSPLTVRFEDVVEYTGADHAVFAGRETIAYGPAGTTRAVVEARTSRYFRFDRERSRWLQYHHHGSVDDPDALSAYRHAVLP
jgi:MFS family permease